ncbi:MAG: universal stress protein [Thermodesulfovibrionia bacterium]|nr:universal stress protein [Thermodesulfovibrionia bacterium]
MAQLCPTAKIEKLLLPTDGSEFSEGAIREAVNLAKTCSSKLFVVSVIETNPEYESIAPQLIEKAEKETRQHLESVKNRAAKEGVDCEIIARQGEDPYKYIVDEAAKHQVSMIIMGRRGRKGLKRLMMGSVTAKVIGHSPCNVLVVPRAARLEFRKILVATDGSKYSNAAASEAVAIAKRCGSSLIAASVVPYESISPLGIVHSEMQWELVTEESRKAAENNIKNVKEIAEKEDVKIEELILEGRPYEAIINAAKEKRVDLIVVGSHGRTGLDRLLMGSVTERIIGHADCAVLVVKVSKI